MFNRSFPLEEQICRQLWEVQKGTQDYLSHYSALYYLGFSDRLPHPITLVSSGRRRARTIEGNCLAFVFHLLRRHRETVKVKIGSHDLLISSLEQTLVDLVTDLHLLQDDHDLARLFSCLPYDVAHVFKLARLAGETPLRRVVFWVLYSGRAGWNDIPDDLSRSPVKLFPSHDPASFVWEGRLWLFIPREVLRRRLWATGSINDSRESDWRELLEYQAFQTWQIKKNWLAICDDPRSESRQCLEAFFHAESIRALREHPRELLVDVFGRFVAEPPIGGFPRLLLSWISSRVDFFQTRKTEILSQARNLMESDDPHQLEAGLYHACKLGFLEEALEVIASRGLILFQAGKLHALAVVCKTALEEGKPLPIDARRLYARTLARSFQFNKALEVATEVRQGKEGSRLTLIERGELAYTAGVIHQQKSSFPGALNELNEAQRCFSEAGYSHGVLKVLAVLGNLHVSQGRFSEARKCYLKGISQLPKRGSEDFLAMLVNNLGFLEFKACRFQQAARFLSRARALYRDKGNPLVEATSLITQGKAMLGIGNVPKAFRLFHEAWSCQVNHPGSGYAGETAALIAWSCELLGRQATAQPWWNFSPKANEDGVPPASAVVVHVLRILSGLVAGKPETVWKHLEPLSLLAVKLSLPPDEIAFHKYLHGMIEFCTGSGKAYRLFRSAIETLALTANPCLYLQLVIMEFLSAPSPTSRKSFSNALTRFVTDQFYDPLWLCYADRLISLNIPEGKPFLHLQLSKTSIPLLEAFSTRAPGMKKVLKQLCRMKESLDSLTLIRSGQAKAFCVEEFERWKTERKTGCLCFAGPTGELRFSGRKAYLRPGSQPHRILTQLLLAYPAELPLNTLYQSVWGGEFDPDYDAGALKTTLTRLRNLLKSLTSAIRLVWGKRQKNPGGIFLQIDCPWECVI